MGFKREVLACVSLLVRGLGIRLVSQLAQMAASPESREFSVRNSRRGYPQHSQQRILASVRRGGPSCLDLHRVCVLSRRYDCLRAGWCSQQLPAGKPLQVSSVTRVKTPTPLPKRPHPQHHNISSSRDCALSLPPLLCGPAQRHCSKVLSFHYLLLIRLRYPTILRCPPCDCFSRKN